MSGWVELACRPVICRAEYGAQLREEALGRLKLPADIWEAAATGDAGAVGAFLAADPELVNATGGPFGWPPLLYGCCSRLRRGHEAVRLLLGRGAAVNARCDWLTPLAGAVAIADDPELVRLLLAAGADPDDGESLYHACGLPHNETLRLLLAGGARVSGTNALNHKLDFADLAGLRLLLAHGADPNEGDSLSHAIRRGREADAVALLLAHGAVVEASHVALATRYGAVEVMALLPVDAGPPLSETDRFLGACARADAAAAGALAHLLPGLTPAERSLVADLAALGRLEAVRLMLDLGFAIETPGDWGGPPLHQAAYHGHLPLVALLLERDASPASRNGFGGDALGAARAGAIHCLQPGGDHAGVIERLERL